MAGLGPRVRPPTDVGPGLGGTRMVPSFRVGVAFTLAADGAAMAPQTAGDLGIPIALKPHSVDDISFVHGKMTVRHREHSLALKSLHNFKLPDAARDVALIFLLHLPC